MSDVDNDARNDDRFDKYKKALALALYYIDSENMYYAVSARIDQMLKQEPTWTPLDHGTESHMQTEPKESLPGAPTDYEVREKAKAYATPPDGWMPVDNWIEIREVERARRDAYYAGYKSCMSDLRVKLTADSVMPKLAKNPEDPNFQEHENWLGQQCYKGNSVGFIYDKMLARGVGIDRLRDRIRELEAERDEARMKANELGDTVVQLKKKLNLAKEALDIITCIDDGDYTWAYRYAKQALEELDTTCTEGVEASDEP